jgi:hypothetical protein
MSTAPVPVPVYYPAPYIQPAQGPSVSQELYSGSAVIGKIAGTVGGIITVLVCIFLILLGSSMIHKKKIFTENVKVEIVGVPDCEHIIEYTNSRSNSSSSNYYRCNTNIKYSFNGTEYTKSVVFPYQITKESNPSIWLDPNDPENILVEGPTNFGPYLIVGSILIILVVIFYLYTIYKYKSVASIAGGSFVLGNLFRR